MLKESILFVAATGLLIYFVTPSNEPPEADPVKEEVQKTVKPSAETSDDGWGDDEEDAAEGESFTFGEPMTYLDGENDEKSTDEDDSSDRQEQSDNSDNKVSRKAPSANRSNTPSANSPRSGELGSLDNPIILKTKNPPSTEDN